MDSSRDYRRNAFGEKDVLTARWQWEPLNINQPFNVPSLSCELYAQWNNRNNCFNSPCACVFARKAGRTLGVTALSWVGLIEQVFPEKSHTWVGQQQKNCPTSFPWNQIISEEGTLHLWKYCKEKSHLNSCTCRLPVKLWPFSCLHLKVWSRSQELHYRAPPVSGEFHGLMLCSPIFLVETNTSFSCQI